MFPKLRPQHPFQENHKVQKSKGNLKLLNVGELEKPINLQVSYASKTAIEAIEKFGGKIKLTKK